LVHLRSDSSRELSLEIPEPSSSNERRDLIKQGKRRFVFKSRDSVKAASRDSNLRQKVSNRSLLISTPYNFKHQVHLGPEDSTITTIPTGNDIGIDYDSIVVVVFSGYSRGVGCDGGASVGGDGVAIIVVVAVGVVVDVGPVVGRI